MLADLRLHRLSSGVVSDRAAWDSRRLLVRNVSGRATDRQAKSVPEGIVSSLPAVVVRQRSMKGPRQNGPDEVSKRELDAPPVIGRWPSGHYCASDLRVTNPGPEDRFEYPTSRRAVLDARLLRFCICDSTNDSGYLLPSQAVSVLMGRTTRDSPLDSGIRRSCSV